MKYGRILRGPQMLSPEEFNRRQKGDGIGFKTTELGKMMRIPLRKEAQHFQIMGDTGVGKTQLIMQILRQIRERGDSAIVYDPACEYLQRFFDKERGDIVLNPLDERCPYWGPAQEMGSNAEADAIAASLYQPATDVKDEFFHQTPAQIFAHLLEEGTDAAPTCRMDGEQRDFGAAGSRAQRWLSISIARPVRSGQVSWLLLVWSRNASGSCRRKDETESHSGMPALGRRSARDGSSLLRGQRSGKRSVLCIPSGSTCSSCAC